MSAGVSGAHNDPLHISKLANCPLSCDLEEGQNCCLVQVKPRRSCSFPHPPPIQGSQTGTLQQCYIQTSTHVERKNLVWEGELGTETEL